MNVKKIMTHSIVTVELDDSLKMVKEIFDSVSFHHLLVLDEGKLFGIVSDRDLLKAISPNIGQAAETEKDLATLNKRVHQVLSRKPITVSSQADIYDAIAIFNENRISCIPVVDENNVPVGILSWRDILKVIGTKRKKSK
ncbi:MAG: CBS domain-containing protein [Pseudomonadales bacterium]|nr:CBS domain-containing protein [Pseudomonadales bacterium]